MSGYMRLIFIFIGLFLFNMQILDKAFYLESFLLTFFYPLIENFIANLTRTAYLTIVFYRY